MSEDTFSRRFGYRSPPEITIREAAPDGLRQAVVELARDLGMDQEAIVSIASRTVYLDDNQYIKTWIGIKLSLSHLEWYLIYDLAETIYKTMKFNRYQHLEMSDNYEEQLNRYFEDKGVGWRMRSGKIQVRGSEPFEVATRGAAETLAKDGRQTAANEIREALRDLSRRPEPDITGAIRHAMAALECVARDVSGQDSATLGRMLNDSAAAMGIRPPLDKALEKLWGFASDRARHLREGESPDFEEAELVVTVAAAVSVYLSKKASSG